MYLNNFICLLTWTQIVERTLLERKKMLEAKIKVSQINAKSFGGVVQEYSKLKRKLKVAEATYQVLIERVKSESIMSGYNPEAAEIYEYAIAPLTPTEPKLTRLLVFAFILGLIIGLGVVILITANRKTFYTKEALFFATRPNYLAKSKPLSVYRKSDLKTLNKRKYKTSSVSRDLKLEIYKQNSKQIIITSSDPKFHSNELARILAHTMQLEDTKVAIIDFSTKNKKVYDDKKISSYFVIEENEYISILTPDYNGDILDHVSKRDFIENIQTLNPYFDYVFLCADNSNVFTLLRAVQKINPFHITLARLKYSRFETLSKMSHILPIKGLLYG